MQIECHLAHLSLALCGLGAAGTARLQALASIPNIKLAGLVSRRPGIGDRSWVEVLQDPRVEAVAISTENTDHPTRVRSALLADKHVLVDFPLAMGGKEGRELFALAREKNRILHVEHIALLSDEHQELKQKRGLLGKLQKGEYLFQAGWSEKLADTRRTGPYPILAISRLLQVADLFGPFTIQSHEMELKNEGFRLHLHLQFGDGGILAFTEERKVGLPRRRTLLAECEGGSLNLKTQALSQGLFAKDLEWFRDRILLGKSCYYDEERMLGVLDQLEKILQD